MKNKNGFIAMTSILVISAVVLIISITVSMLSIGEGQSGLAHYKGENTLTFVEGCMEDALINARNNVSYNGGNITRPEGTCVITVVKSGNWTITATTTNTFFKRTIEAVITRASSITILSWKEI